jgi:hypothetical protein
MFTFIMSKSDWILDVMPADFSVPAVCAEVRSKISSVGCVLRESQTAPHVLSLTQQKPRFQSTRPLISRRAPATARTSWLPSSRLPKMRGFKLFRRLFPRNATHLRERNYRGYIDQAWLVPDCVLGPLPKHLLQHSFVQYFFFPLGNENVFEMLSLHVSDTPKP